MDIEKDMGEKITPVYLSLAERMYNSGKNISAFYFYKKGGDIKHAEDALRRESEIFKVYGFDEEAKALYAIANKAISDPQFDDIKITDIENDMIKAIYKKIRKSFFSDLEQLESTYFYNENFRSITHSMMVAENLYRLKERLSYDWPPIYKEKSSERTDYIAEFFNSALDNYSKIVYPRIKELVYGYDETLYDSLTDGIDEITEMTKKYDEGEIEVKEIWKALDKLINGSIMDTQFESNFYDRINHRTEAVQKQYKYNYEAIEKLFFDDDSINTKMYYLYKTISKTNELLMKGHIEKAFELIGTMISRASRGISTMADYEALLEQAEPKKSKTTQSTLESYMDKLRK